MLVAIMDFYKQKFVTGYWKTNQNVTFGLFRIIGPADSYTHTLPMHCCINRLS